MTKELPTILYITAGGDQKKLVSTLSQEGYNISVEAGCRDFTLTNPSFQACLISVDGITPSAVMPWCRITQLYPRLPLIFILPENDINSAVTLAKMKIRYIYEHPLTDESIQSILGVIKSAGKDSSMHISDLLSDKEQQVLDYLMHGYTNKQISVLLKKSVRTIEEHRSSIMSKMGYESIVDIACDKIAKEHL